MGFHQKNLSHLGKGKSLKGVVGESSKSSGGGGKNTKDCSATEPAITESAAGGGGGAASKRESITMPAVLLNKNLPSRSEVKSLSSNLEMSMIERKIKIIEDLEAFQQALPLFSSIDHHAVHININDDGEPILFECVCGEEVLKEIQFLRHLIHSLGTLDLRSLSFFATSKIENLTGKKVSGTSLQEELDRQFPAAQSASQQQSLSEPEPSLHQLVEEKQDLSQRDIKAAVTAVSSITLSSPSKHPKKEKKKKKSKSKKSHHHHRGSQEEEFAPATTGTGSSSSTSAPSTTPASPATHDVKVNGVKKRKKILQKHPKYYYWQNRDGHGVKSRVQAGENEGKYVCYCGSMFMRLSSIDNHVSNNWKKRDFKCEEPGCSQAFKHKHHLKKHGKVHLRQKALSSSAPVDLTTNTTSHKNSNGETAEATGPEQSSVPHNGQAVTDKCQKAAAAAAPSNSKKNNSRAAATAAATVAAAKGNSKRKKGKRKNASVFGKKLKLKCPKSGCAKIFITKKGLRLHIQAQHDKIPVICMRCGTDVKYETCLLAHQRSTKCKPKVNMKVEVPPPAESQTHQDSESVNGLANGKDAAESKEEIDLDTASKPGAPDSNASSMEVDQ